MYMNLSVFDFVDYVNKTLLKKSCSLSYFLNNFGSQLPDYNVVFGTYAGNYDYFSSYNIYLSDWLNSYGNCLVNSIKFEEFDCGRERYIL